MLSRLSLSCLTSPLGIGKSWQFWVLRRSEIATLSSKPTGAVAVAVNHWKSVKGPRQPRWWPPNWRLQSPPQTTCFETANACTFRSALPPSARPEKVFIQSIFTSLLSNAHDTIRLHRIFVLDKLIPMSARPCYDLQNERQERHMGLYLGQIFPFPRVLDLCRAATAESGSSGQGAC